MGEDDGVVIEEELLGGGGEVDLLDHVVADFGTEALGLLGHDIHEVGAHDAMLEAGVVLDFGGDGELSTGLDAGEEEGLHVGAAGIDRGGEAGGAGADDDDGVDGVAHGDSRVSWGAVRYGGRGAVSTELGAPKTATRRG